MSKVLILFAHPALEKSRVNKRLMLNFKSTYNITINDLYEEYFDFNIDVEREKKLLVEHDIIIFHHPFFWYSTPALLKQWEDLVLEHGWAYGSKGTALVGKKLMNIITTGGSSQAYTKESINQHTIREFLLPIEQTAKLCGMIYLPPYLIQGTHRLTEKEIEDHAKNYNQLLKNFSEDKFSINDLLSYETFNEFLQK
ncbi:MAG: NAD(P)H-dependent oxidoreductase [Ignavibacteriaceae bacterium]|jgi:glutathione-regulated potassium-efflux system ancillary protein KefG|nr:NAD(P)H-dependent oxidoreductase [Ignavibacteriaceae bacterium]MCU0414781.1 NAD(P)H-dependent oxidoreductase [Ignavibacteriaceae bacterium]